MNSIEGVVAKEAWRFVKKDRTKLKLTLGLYALSGKDRELGKVARASYFFIRHLDDLLDGEMTSTSDPLAYAENLKDQIARSDYDDSMPLARLAKFAIPVLEKRGTPQDNPNGDFLRVIDALVFDYHRRMERGVLTADELGNYYHEVLDPGLNLMLIGFESSIRANDLPDFSPNLGRLYSLRDLDKDWTLGFVNIPRNILQNAGVTQFSDFSEVNTNPTIEQWKINEFIEASENLNLVQQQVSVYDEPLARGVLKGFISQAIKAV